MDVRHLELLRELADRGSITAVARASHRTVSAVSQQLRTAQREFGMALTEPDGRGLRLTEAGRLLADGGRRVQTTVAQVQAEWDAYRNDAGGSVSILAFPSSAAVFYPAVVAAADLAGIDLRLDDADLAEVEFAERTADYDIVVAHSLDRRRPAGTDGLVVRQVAVEPLDIAMAPGHPLAALPTLRAADLAGQRWIGVPEGYPFDSVLRGIAATLDETLDVRQRLRDNRVAESLVRTGDVLAVLPRFTTVPDDGLVLREIVDVPAERTLSAIMRPDRARRRAVTTVLDAIVEAMTSAAG
ncbi:LysR family transcriptional regulator [Gordonia humi]|uniref:DNA-binding transcriptional LysR family regulator n=1 Tax=Gordonia humi TaxID=686429 RepID=A0A840F112_9ACTN|nr:LysR family transcriptional regulator [Gordonia humi]MBB4135656.1 DNA-binding transcriptional LysR family regulator [Gordonia humi]